MWTRFLIKCGNCGKTTNLRVHIPEKELLTISFHCLGCETELKAILKLEPKELSWSLTMQKGTHIPWNSGQGVYSGDFFYEFSDTLTTHKPSTKPHERMMPTLRLGAEQFINLKSLKDTRRMHSSETWEDFQDLARAYERFDKSVIRKLSEKITSQFFPELSYKDDLDYHSSYFMALNFLVFPWIDYENHCEFVEFIHKNVFTGLNATHPEITDFVDNILTPDLATKIRIDVCEILIRFADIREYFLYASNAEQNYEAFAPIQGFVHIKNFYTDCFEFLGRNSHLIFRIQNFLERGGQNNVPPGSPSNITTSAMFSAVDHGQKLAILNLSKTPELLQVFSKSFDSKLRNGINHFKAKIDKITQIITYYPITKKPDEAYDIRYVDFLNLTLDSLNSVLKIGQLMKLSEFYKNDVDTTNK